MLKSYIFDRGTSNQDILLLFLRTRVQFLGPTLGGSQPPKIPAPEDIVSCFGLHTYIHSYAQYSCIDTHMQIKIINNNNDKSL